MTMSEFTDKEVAAAMRYYGKHGEYPPCTPPEVIELAERLREASLAVSETVG
jgi:hypothetical protein